MKNFALVVSTLFLTAIVVLFAFVIYLKSVTHGLNGIEHSKQLLAGRTIKVHGYITTIEDGVYGVTDNKCVGGYFLSIQHQIIEWDDLTSQFLKDVTFDEKAKANGQILEADIIVRINPKKNGTYLVLENVLKYNVIRRGDAKYKNIPNRCFEAY